MRTLFDAELVGYGGRPDGAPPRSPAPMFVGVLMVVIGMLFVLLTIAYLGRSQLGDWRSLGDGPLAEPWRLWANTAMLAASGVALHLARAATRRGRAASARAAIAAAAALALGFVGGQLAAWRSLVAEGYTVADNPANSFFYLVTGLHGVHLLVGLLVLGIVAARALRAGPGSTALVLCSRYFDFLLVVWLGMFALVASRSESLDAFAAICGLR